MIELPHPSRSASASDLTIKIVGIGGAGANALDRLVLDGVPGAQLVAINTDAQALIGSVAPEKVQIGRTTTRGLGTGGDPELGYVAAEEGADEVRAALTGASMVFLLVGLGGGTGSGSAPLIANYAREHHALVVVFATLPFQFEGRRRMAQAEEALAALQQQAHVVICFENDRMGDAVNPNAGIHEAFAAADHTVSQAARAIAAMVNQRGLIHIGFDELVQTLRSQNARCIFGFGEAEGDNRAHETLARALKSPLMDRGRLLEDTANVMVNVVGGKDMTLNEVQILMDELGRHISDETRILFGCAVDPRLGGKMRVTILSAIGAGGSVRLATLPGAAVRSLPSPAPIPVREAPQIRESQTREPARAPVPVAQSATSIADSRDEVETEASAAIAAETTTSAEQMDFRVRADLEEEEDAAAVTEPVGTKAAADKLAKAAAAKAAREAKQEQMQFEPVTRGRFEKSEPTIVDGEDLDVPTFLRRNLKLK